MVIRNTIASSNNNLTQSWNNLRRSFAINLFGELSLSDASQRRERSDDLVISHGRCGLSDCAVAQAAPAYCVVLILP
jgi:hypothetical protein